MQPFPSLQIGQHLARYPIIQGGMGIRIGRALRNAFVEKVIANSPDLEKRCLASCLHVCKCRDEQKDYCIVQVLDKAARGDVENGLIFSGSNAGRAQQIIPVAELMTALVA